MKQIKYHELLKLEVDSILVIDLRNSFEYSKSHFPKAINIPYDIFISNVGKYLSKNNVYYLICNTGNLSYRASLYLCSLGYKVINIIDGYQNSF